MSTTRKVQIIDKKEFVLATLNSENETFVLYMAFFCPIIYLSQKTIIAYVEVRNVIISTKYLDFVDVFSSDFATELSEYIGINNHFINLIKGQQPPYRLIYSLEPVKLETLKTYIKINLVKKFIKLSKSPAGTPILFVCKKNRSI